MSGSSGQNFSIRLTLDGKELVLTGIGEVQARATQAGAAVERASESGGRSMSTLADAAQNAQGKFSGLSEAAGRAGNALRSAGFNEAAAALQTVGATLDVATAAATRLGASSAAAEVGVGAFLARMATGVTVIAAVAAGLQAAGLGINQAGTAAQTATGYTTTYEAALNSLNGVLGTTAERAAIAAEALFRTQRQAALVQGEQALGQLFEQRSSNQTAFARTEQQLAEAREGLSSAEQRAQTASGRFGSRGALTQDVERRRADVARLEAQRTEQASRNEALNRQEAELAGRLRDAEGRIYPTPAGPDAPASPRTAGGGGSGARADRANDVLRERDALVQRNLTADERYTQGLERIADLNDRLIAQGNDPLPDEVVQREATRLMEEYERATQRAADGTQNLADGTRELERAGAGAAKALSGAFEDLVFEGQNFDDVLKNLERSLLRVGNQAFVQPLFQQGIGALFGSSTGGAGGGGSGGAIGSLISSLFGGSGGGAAGAASAATQIYATAAEVGPFLLHEGGIVGSAGRPGPMVPLSLFANAPRYHGGGIIGPDERPIIAQVGERMLNRQEAAEYARGGGRGVTVNINGVRNPDEFRQSRSQVTASVARALGRSGRNR